MSVFKKSGEFVTSFGQFSNPVGIIVDDDGFVHVYNHEHASKVYILQLFTAFVSTKSIL